MPLDRDLSFTIRPKNDGQPLATALRNILGAEQSWSDIRRLVSSRRVHLNGNLVLDDARTVRAGDVLHLFVESRAPLPTEMDIPIRHTDEDLVVIEKPAGLNTLRHREEHDLPQQRKDKAPTLDELLQRKLNHLFHTGQLHLRPPPSKSSLLPKDTAGSPAHPLHPLAKKTTTNKRRPFPPPSPRRALNPQHEIRNPQGSSPPQLRPVHRLDRDTSGLMLFALSANAEQLLERDFARHTIQREYLAIVHGHLAGPRTIESYLVRDRGDGRRGSSPLGPNATEAQRAVTHVSVTEHIGSAGSPLAYSIVECRLETGRTHQIRIHLSEAGHPLAGEKVYLPAGVQPWTSTGPLAPPPRHALHSARLSFTHPVKGHVLEFRSDLPRDLSGWLKRLRQLVVAETRL